MNRENRSDVLRAPFGAARATAEHQLIDVPQGDIVSLEIPAGAHAVAVCGGENGWRLWQSIYTQQDCQNAAHIWLITPENAFYHLHAPDGTPCLGICPADGVVTLRAPVLCTAYADFPCCDVLGNRFALDLGDEGMAARTLAAFYWHTMIPCVIEGKSDAYPDGYVLSTLAQSVYAGTYPDVDHEFQCKGRVACAGAFELDLVRRMIELQLRLMQEDPVGLWRNPCALQPDGVREYHVRRSSGDGRANAVMFLISGNVEVLESAWLLTAMTKDTAWLARHIGALEGAASLTEGCIDQHGRLWSDVFYEDQIIKDGMECLSACLAAHGFGKLAQLEALLDRHAQAVHYRALEERLGQMIARPVPYGFWDEQNGRFIDWLDRDGVTHDHMHLLANALPVLFGYGTPEQRARCRAVIERHFGEYQRFPTFLSPRIEDYTPSEIGVPYDLCAAGRYWCWDAAYWHALGRADVLRGQVSTVSKQARADHYEMGERYDMNHIYYISDRNWHGAAHYYEYPNVYWWVVVNALLGIQPSLRADLRWRPLPDNPCSFSLEAWGVAGRIGKDGLHIENLRADRQLTVELDAFLLCPGLPVRTLHLSPGASIALDSWGNDA